MGAILATMAQTLINFIYRAGAYFLSTLPYFIAFSVISSLSICFFIIGGVFGPFISIMFIYILLLSRLKKFWKTGLYLNTSTRK
tara:strand:- start:26 stop:277 length:252 start_codon:yes stop_codon:yes gene_type:complete